MDTQWWQSKTNIELAVLSTQFKSNKSLTRITGTIKWTNLDPNLIIWRCYQSQVVTKVVLLTAYPPRTFTVGNTNIPLVIRDYDCKSYGRWIVWIWQ